MNACMHVYGMYVVLASTNIAVTLRACMYIYGARIGLLQTIGG